MLRLIKKLKAESPVVLVGGMALNQGMIQAINEMLKDSDDHIEILSHQDAIFSGAIGASLWGGYRHNKLKKEEELIVN